jgi:aminoglycoside phosphotransferase (APT) family kinase protein
MSRLFVKRYPDISARRRAEANYRWLAKVPSPARLPELLSAAGPDLRFERIEGRHALPQDLTMLAAHLGDIHGAAYAAELNQAKLGQSHQAAGGHLLPAFPDRRVNAVTRELEAGNVPDTTLTITRAKRLIADADGPAAFYKDANPRNFLITPAGAPVTIDFDDLTLAPFGYDLAKLIVTLAMTHGHLRPLAITEALDAYNGAAGIRSGRLAAVTRHDLANWAEIHHILTSRYTADGRYPHRWNEVRAS